MRYLRFTQRCYHTQRAALRWLENRDPLAVSLFTRAGKKSHAQIPAAP